MLGNSALRVRPTEATTAPQGQLLRISEYKRAPMHFEFDISLRQQAELRQDEYKISNEEASSFIEYLDSRQWTPAELPDGADAWVVVGDPVAIFGDYRTGVSMALNKLRLRSTLFLNNELSGMLDEPARTQRTRQCMALMRQTQPVGKLKVMAVQLGFGDGHDCLSPEQAEPQFSKKEFGLSDFELANLLSTYPGCLENREDRGLIAMGDYCSDGYAPSYSVHGRILNRRLKPVSDPDHSFRVATAFLFK